MAYIGADINITKSGKGIKAKDLERYLQSLAKNVVTVGVHKDKGSELVKRAAHTEFGTTHFTEGWNTPVGAVKKVPPRPVIRMYLYPEMKKEIGIQYQIAMNYEKKSQLVNPDNSAFETQKSLGQECVYMQREKIASGGFDQSTNDTGLDPEHNGSRFVEYKGFDFPWIGSSETMSAIDYKVGKNNE